MIKATKHQNPPLGIRDARIEKLIVQQIKVFEDWDKRTNMLDTQYEKKENLQIYL